MDELEIRGALENIQDNLKFIQEHESNFKNADSDNQSGLSAEREGRWEYRQSRLNLGGFGLVAAPSPANISGAERERKTNLRWMRRTSISCT